MKEKTSDGQIIIVLTEHPVLGILLIPYIAERLSDNTLQLVEQAFHASAEAMNRMSEAESFFCLDSHFQHIRVFAEPLFR